MTFAGHKQLSIVILLFAILAVLAKVTLGIDQGSPGTTVYYELKAAYEKAGQTVKDPIPVEFVDFKSQPTTLPVSVSKFRLEINGLNIPIPPGMNYVRLRGRSLDSDPPDTVDMNTEYAGGRFEHHHLEDLRGPNDTFPRPTTLPSGSIFSDILSQTFTLVDPKSIIMTWKPGIAGHDKNISCNSDSVETFWEIGKWPWGKLFLPVTQAPASNAAIAQILQGKCGEPFDDAKRNVESARKHIQDLTSEEFFRRVCSLDAKSILHESDPEKAAEDGLLLGVQVLWGNIPSKIIVFRQGNRTLYLHAGAEYPDRRVFWIIGEFDQKGETLTSDSSITFFGKSPADDEELLSEIWEMVMAPAY